GGGTGMIGDPSGRTDMRNMLTREDIDHNVSCIKKQMERFIDFTDDKAILVNNADWLLDLNYVDFIRDIGMHFSVNRMLSAECFKQRLEKGLSFLEFNYMLMQGYDFYVLHQKFGCKMQLGGDDQWSNMIAGMELIRRKDQESAFAMTCTLLTNSEGKKMGKTQKGALWLDENKTTPYEFYQYWRNVADADVEKCLSLLTFLPMDEVRRLSSLEGSQINESKKVLAFEITNLIHGQEKALAAQKASEALFEGSGNLDNVEAVEISREDLGRSLLDILVSAKLIPSKSEGKRLVTQGGLYANDVKVEDFNLPVVEDMFNDGHLLIRRGKKKYNKILIK
ncbi:tyrosine--tRNA ligase, partial [Clostridium sp.]|uniref:tyrosine--tRNA ligase n=1 Tax=Clostridium sp. TaxID=1506 RepID=UPI002FC9CBF0